MKYKFYKKDGSQAGEKEIANVPTFEGRDGFDALRQVVLAYQANARQGSACAKSKDEVRGSGKKPWRQKGTGNARHGSRRSPIWVGGGVVHGPRPRDYTQKINVKVKKVALKRAIFERSSDHGISLIEAFEVAEPKTKLFNAVLDNIKPEGTVLLADTDFTEKFALSARNIPHVFMVDARSINALDFGNYKKIIMTEEAFNLILARVNN